MSDKRKQTALMLPGGGARGAYQVGVLQGIRELAGNFSDNPFPIITGTSAGAINAVVLASHADNISHGIDRLEHFWSHLTCADVYRTSWWDSIRSGLHWLGALALGRLGFPPPESLLDTSPLYSLLSREVNFPGIGQAISNRHLEAIAVTVSSYATGRGVTYFQGDSALPTWSLARNEGRRSLIQAEHMMASAALPLLFPPIAIHNEYFGDGGLRQTAPLSPAIRLGADRVLVVATRDEKPDPEPVQRTAAPSIGEVAGHMLDIVFMDNLQADIYRVERINQLLRALDEKRRSDFRLKPVEMMVIRPSRDVRELTSQFAGRLPSSVKALLRTVGAWRPGTRIPSYLLFDTDYCSELIALGKADAHRHSAELRAFLGIDSQTS